MIDSPSRYQVEIFKSSTGYKSVPCFCTAVVHIPRFPNFSQRNTTIAWNGKFPLSKQFKICFEYAMPKLPKPDCKKALLHTSQDRAKEFNRLSKQNIESKICMRKVNYGQKCNYLFTVWNMKEKVGY